MAEPQELIDPKLLERVNLLMDQLKPQQLEQRGAISKEAQRSGQRGTSTFRRAFQKQLGMEEDQFRDVISQALTNQINIDESDKSRKFQAEQKALDRSLQRDLQKDNIAAQTDIAEDDRKARGDAALVGGISKIIGTIFGAGA